VSYIERRDSATGRLVAALEDESLRVHIEQGLYPEYVQYLDVVKRALTSGSRTWRRATNAMHSSGPATARRGDSVSAVGCRVAGPRSLSAVTLTSYSIVGCG
jgi:hypothetical protein